MKAHWRWGMQDSSFWTELLDRLPYLNVLWIIVDFLEIFQYNWLNWSNRTIQLKFPLLMDGAWYFLKFPITTLIRRNCISDVSNIPINYNYILKHQKSDATDIRVQASYFIPLNSCMLSKRDEEMIYRPFNNHKLNKDVIIC